ncbi:DUF6197 family protein [Streptomyces lavendulae]|uniref:DUF6197 family protein n=1 Tax=Streptomyces lavendulae TaxID=1914 RepID=UPI003404E670
MTAPAIQRTTAHGLADEIESWLRQITPARLPAPALPATDAERTYGGWTLAELTASALAEVDRSQQATLRAQAAVRPTLIERLTGRRRPITTASAHIRQAAALLATSGWCRGELADTDGRHCILGALQAVDADPDTTGRAHAYIRAAMADPAPYARPSAAYEDRFARECRQAGADVTAMRRQHEIAVHNNVSLPTVGAVLDLLDRAAHQAATAGD